ncbi:DNA methyltransferase [Candidatus Desantisbacteria bacterium CG1_02_38_46]|uniref:Methyltransferase n=1 Tax=Candidatus Desantisbacteria bacterium CG1_02_38_46 TaxID=1817893 RepID=A0A1J4SJ52_9BACT|nr:MAG: DNA methyltransferase [Candidatus Desantisbacteria bacterium CG1_02_38_46]
MINKTKLLGKIEELQNLSDKSSLRYEIGLIQQIVNFPKSDKIGIMNIDGNGDTIIMNKGALLEELSQISQSQTFERAHYYIERLKKGVEKIRTSKINDINLNRWKEYTDILTDSLWVLDKRDASGAHMGWYWGNFIPQIPHQMMLRYTKKSEWVLDPFVGSGTTLIECKRLGRNGIGLELNPEVAEKAKALINKEQNPFNVKTIIETGDSRKIDLKKLLEKQGIKETQLLIMHPPYHNIIKFSNSADDLSNAPSTESFLKMFGEVIDNTYPILQKGRYLAIVIGDKYSRGEWIPLGFYTMQEVMKRGYSLKSIIVKNFEETRGKRNQKELWQYRALVGGFYIFKHEYILLFKKEK